MISFKSFLAEAIRNPHAGVGRGVRGLRSKLKTAAEKLPEGTVHMSEMTASQASDEANRIEKLSFALKGTVEAKKSAVNMASTAHLIARSKHKEEGNAEKAEYHLQRSTHCNNYLK